MHPPTIQYYDDHAGRLAARYATADVSAMHHMLERWLPTEGTILEIGCGAGRESAWMAARGLKVTATDASAAMLTEAKKQPDAGRISFSQETFPLEPTSPLLKERFDAIVCIAVLMHVPDKDLFDVLFHMRGLLNPGGRVIVSFCSNREPDAADARLFVNRQPEEYQLLFERIGFSFRYRQDSPDGLGRSMAWTTLIFDSAADSGGRPVDQIETIVNRDKKTATYKLALLRALGDLAQIGHHHVRWHHDGTVSLPLSLISEKWLYYYWPLHDTPDRKPIPQISGSRNLGFAAELSLLIDRFANANKLSGFHCAFESNRLDANTKRLLQNVLKKIGQTIVKGPVTYASQGGFRYDARAKHVHFHAGLWREMSLLGHWISDAILFRWAELCVDLSGKRIDTATVLGQLITRPETERDVLDVRTLYSRQAHLTCVWTHVTLGRKWDVDHVIPFSLWHNNDLWNLLPADSTVNNNKRDKLVSRDTLTASRGTVIDYWQQSRSAMPERFDFEISRTLFGRNHAEPQWEKPAFAALVEAVETLAIQRHLDRWEPASAIRQFHAAPPVPTVSEPPRTADWRPTLIHDADEIRRRAFITALPIVGSLAAGPFFDGFETRNPACLEDVDWVEVPESVARRTRFVVRVAGDSMAPLFTVGDWVVFEYHRTPRKDGEVVVAADFTSGEAYAIKRFKADANDWCFLSDNPAYPPIRIPKNDMPAYPILGTLVGPLTLAGAFNVASAASKPLLTPDF